MNAWFDEALALLRWMAGSPSSTAEWAIFAGVIIVVSLGMMKIMGLAVANPNSNWVRNLLVLALGGALILAVMIAGRKFLGPLLADKVEPRWIDITCAGVGFFLLAVPLLCLFQRVRYLTALVTLAVTGVTAALVYLFAASAWQGTRDGKARFDAVEQRTDDLNRDIE